jgi:excisionase family DNA binding protein
VSEWISAKEAAERLGLSWSMVRRYCQEGRLGQRVGGVWVLAKAEVDAFSAEPRKHGRPPGGLASDGACVYLIKGGPYYKIGASLRVDARIIQLKMIVPYDDLELIHTIPTDDRYGLERRLHHQFSDKCKGGEWFELEPADVDYIKSLGPEV